MTWTKVCPLVCAALFACASEETEDVVSGAPSEGGTGTGGGASGGSSTSGKSASGGSGVAGSASGGSGVNGGHAGTGGTFSTGGNAAAGTFSNGGVSGAGVGGTAGGAGGKGGSGGAAGSGGKGGGGAGGTGGAPPTQCTGVVIPPKTAWQGSALRSTENDPPSRVFDGNDTTRFATGAAQTGDEWLQIDFGEVVTLNEVRLHTNNGDYFRHYQLRLSNTPQDFTAPILNEADGATGTITVPLTPAKAGRYLTFRQTGMVAPTWWSLHEVTVACQ